MKIVHTIAFTLLVVGGLNWGLSAFNYNIVDMILGAGSMAAKVVYILVGVSAVIEVAKHKHNCRQCNPGSTGTPSM